MISDASLDSYVRSKQRVVDGLRLAQAWLQRRGRSPSVETIRELLARLAQDRFNLVVLGQFKRGKSSLINAVVERPVLPTAVVPLTSVVTSLRYGSPEAAIIRFQGRSLATEVPLADLANYVTERGNPGNEKWVASAEVRIPAPFLRRGLHFVDTPGIGSMNQRNTATTYSFLPEADATIFVTSADAPLSDAEVTFLAAIRQHVRKVFFVLNKIDQLDTAERAEAVAFTEAALREHLGGGAIRLFPLSARLGLQAKQAQDGAALAESGLAALEQALADFLATERGTVLLVATLDRALRLLQQERVLAELAVGGRAEAAEQRIAAARERLARLEQDRAAVLRRWRERLAAWDEQTLAPAIAAFAESERSSLAAALAARIAERGSWDGAERARELRLWLGKTVAERALAWLRDKAADIGTATNELVAEVLPHLEELVTQATKVAAEAFLTGPAGTAVDDHPLTVALPLFEATWPHETCLDFSTLDPGPLPGFLARRLLLRGLQEVLASDLEQATALLRRQVMSYLAAVVACVDRASGQALENVGEQVEEAARVLEHAQTAGATPAGPAEQGPEDLDELVRYLVALRDSLLAADTNSPSDPPLPLAPAIAVSPPTSAAPALPRQEPALDAGNCPICAATWKAIFDFFCQWQYALAFDSAAQQGYRASGGFCRFHTWQLESIASPYGLALGYPPLVERAAQEVAALDGLPTAVASERLSLLLPGSDTCRACRVQHEREAAEIARLLDYLATPAGRAAFRRSRGVCLPHLRSLLDTTGDAEIRTLVMTEQSRRLSELAEALRGYALKVDTRRRKLLTAEEQMASQQALLFLAGDKRLR